MSTVKTVMNYNDWGANAHWYYAIQVDDDSIYNWSVTVNNNCENSQTYFDSFNTGCNGELFETCITRSVMMFQQIYSLIILLIIE